MKNIVCFLALVLLLQIAVPTVRAQVTSVPSKPQTIVKSFYTFKCEAKWGNGGNGEGQFDSPNGIAVDTSGNVYVCDQKNYRIQKFDADGKFIMAFGHAIPSGDDQETRKPDEFTNFMGGLCVDKDGFLYVLDNSLVKKFDKTFTLVSQRVMNDSPAKVLIGPDGYLYEPGQFNQLMKLTRQFKPVVTYPLQQESFAFAIDSQLHFYTSYPPSEILEKYDKNGDYQGKWKRDFSCFAAVFGQDGWGYFSDNHTVYVYDTDGKELTKFGGDGVAKGQFGFISGLAVGPKGEIFACDSNNNRVQKFVKFKVTQWFDQNGKMLKEEETPVVAKTLPANLTQTALYDPASEAKPSEDEEKAVVEKQADSSNNATTDAVKDQAVDGAKKLLGF